ncbi:MAG: S1 domain-containing RNA-binding protein [Oscillospiraceae bacterium]|nr:S1 domain-containing RNA-binding protein [Oscillospiraceae bacterium]
MALKPGSVMDGKIVNIANFGAFVDVEGKVGLVHISEISTSYVKNIRDKYKENDIVKVKVLSVEENGKINLSIKQAIERTGKSKAPDEFEWSGDKNKVTSISFEDRISKFLKDSEERHQDIKKNNESKVRRYKRTSNY